ncbi:hypothetical protein ACTJKO_00260 [Curtobacterium sp. 22159]|uniref:hypothetical protein n=1 Tax=Curtobacterium sp. 22159 TaxID=3453882 RepID=UPI003F87B49C
MTDRSFRDPDAWHRPAAYWFWHRPPTDDEVRTQVRGMHDAGFHSFQVQARLSYPMTGYLDDHFLRSYRLAADEAAARGMVMGIYDDYNWQSGHAGGRAVAGHDEYRERLLFWTRLDDRGRGRVSGIVSATENLGPAAMHWHYETGVPTWTDWRVEHALIVEDDGSVIDRAADARVDGTADGALIALAEADTGTLVLVSARSATSRMANPLNVEAVERFVEVGYEPIRRALGEHVGTTVRYLFFDQPHAISYDWAERDGDVSGSVPWHADLSAALRDAFGPDLPATLAAAFGAPAASTTDAALARRSRFWAIFSGFAIETWIGTVTAWSHRRGLLQSGHEVLSHVGSWEPGTAFVNWDLRANFGLDHFGVDRYRDLTAVDAQDAVGQLSPALGDGVARASGRSGTIVEQYFMTPPPGGAPFSGHWGLTLDELRSTAVRHHFAGMRQMLFHGYTQTDGHDRDHESLVNPRFDFPPGINHEPWFTEHHHRYAEESARLSTFLDTFTPDVRVLLLWPLRTIWTDGPSGMHAEHLGAWARLLSEANVPFRIIDERELTDVDDPPTAEVLILPAVRTLRDDTSVAVLRAARERGVRVVASGRLPSVLESGLPGSPVDVGADLVPEPALEALGRVRAFPPGVAVRTGTDPDGLRRSALHNDGPGNWRPTTDVAPPWAVEWNAGTGSTNADLTHHRPDPARLLRPGELRLLTWTDENDRAAGTGEAALDDQAPRSPLDATWTLALGDAHPMPTDVTGGWQLVDPTFSGTGVYRTTITLERPTAFTIELPHVRGAATVSVGGERICDLGWRPFRAEVSADRTRAGENTIEITVSGTAANRYYAGTGLRSEPEPDGLLAAPALTIQEDRTC